MAATRALALLAKQDVPDSVAALYGLRNVHFGPDYLIPFPFDPRVLLWVAPAVAWAAVASGVAREFIDLEGVSRAARGAARPRARNHARDHQSRRARSEAHRVPRGRRAEDHSRRVDPRRRRHRASDPARQSRDDRARRGPRTHLARGHHDRGSGDVAAARRVRALHVAASPAQGTLARRGAPPALQRQLLRLGDGCVRRRRRASLGRGNALPRDDSARAPGHRRASEREARERHVHARHRAARRLLRRHHGEHRSHRRAAGADRVRREPHRAHHGHRAAHRDAVVLQLRVGAASRRREDGARRADPEGARSVAHRRRRDAGGHGVRSRDPQARLSVQHAQGAGERAHLSRT